MKQANVLLLCVLILVTCCSGCQSEADQILSNIILPQNNLEPIQNNSSPIVISADLEYCTFEEIFSFAHAVVVAEYIGYEPFEKNTVRHEFAVKEIVHGEVPEPLFVYGSGDEFVTPADIEAEPYVFSEKYQKGKTYMLLLEKYDNLAVYKSFIPFIAVEGITIDMDDLSASTMYGEPISKHAEGINFNKALTADTLIKYVADIAQKTVPEYHVSQDYIQSDKLEDIVSGSPNIVRVKTGEFAGGTNGYLYNVERYHCVIQETIAGDLKQGEEIIIRFIPDTVKSGEEYIVALETHDPGASSRYFNISSKNSVFAVEQADEIKEALGLDAALPDNPAVITDDSDLTADTSADS